MSEIEVVVVPVSVFEACVRVLDAARLLVVGDDDLTEEETVERFAELETSVKFADEVIDRSELVTAMTSESTPIDEITLGGSDA